MPTVSQIVESIYPTSQYLAQLDIQKKGLYGGGINNSLADKIYNIGKSVKRIFDDAPSDDTLTKTAYFLYALCGKYGMQAQAISGSAGTVAGITPAAASLPLPIEFIVAGGTLIPTGGSTVNIASFIGYNLAFDRNGLPQGQINNGASYFAWDRVTGDFTCYPAATEFESFRLMPIG